MASILPNGLGMAMRSGVCHADACQTSSSFSNLPCHVQQAVARLLAARELKSFHLTSRQCREAARTSLSVLNLQRHPSCPWEWETMPEFLKDTIDSFPFVVDLRAPGGWREVNLQEFLRAAHGRWPLTSLEVHTQAITTSMARTLSMYCPAVTKLHLFLDVPFQPVSHQAKRIASLAQLPTLTALTCESPLGPDAIRALSSLPRLRDLDLADAAITHEPGASLESLGTLSQLTSLKVSWAAGRTMTTAGPLEQLTNLQRLHIFIGAGRQNPLLANTGRPHLWMIILAGVQGRA
jgi:hypothetical protein